MHLWINLGETMTENTGDVFMPSLVLLIQWGVVFHIALGMKERKRWRRKKMDSEGGEGRVINGGEATETLPVD